MPEEALELDNRKIDRLALEYAGSGGDDESRRRLIHDLAGIVRPVIDWEVGKEHRNNPGIPKENFESLFWEAFWEATTGYNGEIPFMARLHGYINNASINEIRFQNRQKRRIREESLDKLLDETEPEGFTFHDILPGRENVEGEILEREIRKTLADYAQSNERNAKIIQLIEYGCTNLEIAKCTGASRYDAKTRKTVQRAKEGFRVYLASSVA